MIVKVIDVNVVELTALTMFGDMRSTAAGGADIVIVAVVVVPNESNTFNVTGPAATFAGKVTFTDEPFQIPPSQDWRIPSGEPLLVPPEPAQALPVSLKAFDGSLDVVI